MTTNFGKTIDAFSVIIMRNKTIANATVVHDRRIFPIFIVNFLFTFDLIAYSAHSRKDRFEFVQEGLGVFWLPGRQQRAYAHTRFLYQDVQEVTKRNDDHEHP